MKPEWRILNLDRRWIARYINGVLDANLERAEVICACGVTSHGVKHRKTSKCSHVDEKALLAICAYLNKYEEESPHD